MLTLHYNVGNSEVCTLLLIYNLVAEFLVVYVTIMHRSLLILMS